MKNKKNRYVIVFTAIVFIMLQSSNVTAKPVLVNSSDKKIILIDPGHGGFDGGAVSRSGTEEKNINLNIGLFLKKDLEKLGYGVVMTRDTDKALYSTTDKSRSKKAQDLANRCKIKEQSGCSMFVSIHLNMFPESKYFGAQVWYSKFPESKVLAELIQKNFKSDVDSTNERVEKAANNAYKVLRCNDTVPSVIVECGFLSNLKDEKNLKTEEYQNKIADTIAKSIKEYYNKKNIVSSK